VPTAGFAGVEGRFGEALRRRPFVLGFASCPDFRGSGFDAGVFTGACFPGGAAFLEPETEVPGARAWTPLAVACFLLVGGLVSCPGRALRAVLLSPMCGSRGKRLMRPDFLRPSSATNVEGPSASIFFHGGDSAFDRRIESTGVASRTRRLFAGGPSSIVSESWAWPLVPLVPFG
jgi:hypothetical protein